MARRAVSTLGKKNCDEGGEVGGKGGGSEEGGVDSGELGDEEDGAKGGENDIWVKNEPNRSSPRRFRFGSTVRTVRTAWPSPDEGSASPASARLALRVGVARRSLRRHAGRRLGRRRSGEVARRVSRLAEGGRARRVSPRRRRPRCRLDPAAKPPPGEAQLAKEGGPASLARRSATHEFERGEFRLTLHEARRQRFSDGGSRAPGGSPPPTSASLASTSRKVDAA
ncbi:hypothetical protein NL676_007204 [Syzygium grande]|nr:hypothetical protein NL676_007204 [Syzygium grande]